MSAFRRLSPHHANVVRTRKYDEGVTTFAWTLEVMYGNRVTFSDDFPLTDSGRLDALSMAQRMVRGHRIDEARTCSFPIDNGSCRRDAVTADLRCHEHRGQSIDDTHRRLAVEYVNAVTAFYRKENVGVHSQVRPDRPDIVITTGTISALLNQITALQLELHFEQTGDCLSCRGTGIIDAAEHRCGWCNGRGYIEPPVVAENRTLRSILKAIATVIPKNELDPSIDMLGTLTTAMTTVAAVRRILLNHGETIGLTVAVPPRVF